VSVTNAQNKSQVLSPSGQLYDELRQEEINFFVHVPCSLLGELISLSQKDRDVTSLAVTREEEGIGILAGASLAGKRPAILMQNSGLGNCINAVCSLIKYYEIPLVFLISHRGSQGERIDAQIPMGESTEHLLKAIDIETHILASVDEIPQMRDQISASYQKGKSIAFLFPFSFWQDGN